MQLCVDGAQVPPRPAIDVQLLGFLDVGVWKETGMSGAVPPSTELPGYRRSGSTAETATNIHWSEDKRLKAGNLNLRTCAISLPLLYSLAQNTVTLVPRRI